MPPKLSEQLRILADGLIDFISEEELAHKIERSLKEDRPLRIKYGADPSAPDLHLGHTVPLRKLRQFQDLGHTVVFIIGDFTARIGDPTARSETRRMLSREEVNRNAISYQHQVFQILDNRKTETRYNSDWLNSMAPEEFLRLTAQYTVARLLERDDFQKRYRGGKPIALVEFLYPLLQGHDSVIVDADVEIGGTDQKFNLLVGRELMRSAGKEPQVVMTLPIIEGTDGVQKMSKSLGNAIGLEDTPSDMYGKVMSIPDALMESYFRYVSGLNPEEAMERISRLKEGSWHPREAKADLAEQIVRAFHGPDASSAARREFDQVFQKKELPDDIPLIELDYEKADIVSLLKDAGMVASKSEARRMVQQGAVRIEKEKVSDMDSPIDLSRPVLIQCGKRKFARLQHRGGS